MILNLSNERIVNTINVLGELNNAKLPVKVAYAITKNINKINTELKAYNEEKVKLIDKYAEKDEKGELKTNEIGNVILEEEHIEDWNREIAELLSIENEIDIHMINLNISLQKITKIEDSTQRHIGIKTTLCFI